MKMKIIIEKYTKEIENAQEALRLPHSKEYQIQILERISNLKSFIAELEKIDIKYIATRFAHQCRLNGCVTNNDTCELWDKLNKHVI